MRPGRPQLTKPLSYRNILGSKIGELWHCGAGISLSGTDVTGWKGLINGITLSPSSPTTRPTYGADGSNFRGRSVVQTDRSITSGLNVDISGSPLGGPTSLGCLITVLRQRDVSPGTDLDVVFSAYNNVTPFGSSLDFLVANKDSGWGGLTAGYGGIMYHTFMYEVASGNFTNAYGQVETGAALQAQKTWEMGWFGDLTPDYFKDYINGTSTGYGWTSTSTSGGRVGRIDGFNLGKSGTRYSQVSIAFMAYLYTPMTDNERAQLMPLLASEFG